MRRRDKEMEKIIVAGGGIAGLTAGIYARLAGFDAEIYEKNPVVGGECMGWNRNGYHIDNQKKIFSRYLRKINFITFNHFI